FLRRFQANSQPGPFVVMTMRRGLVSFDWGRCRPEDCYLRRCGCGALVLVLVLSVAGLGGGARPARVVNLTAQGQSGPPEEEESEAAAKLILDTVSIEQRRTPRHARLRRAAMVSPAALAIDDVRALLPSRRPAVIRAEIDGRNGLGAPLLC